MKLGELREMLDAGFVLEVVSHPLGPFFRAGFPGKCGYHAWNNQMPDAPWDWESTEFVDALAKLSPTLVKAMERLYAEGAVHATIPTDSRP